MVKVFFRIKHLAIKLIRRHYFNKKISNVFRLKSLDKRVLICMLPEALRRFRTYHTNHKETQIVAEVFNEMGFIVDVIHYSIAYSNLEEYDLVFGYGPTLELKIRKDIKIPTINYSPGLSNIYANGNTLKRLKDVYDKKGHWIFESSRYFNEPNQMQSQLSNALIVLGNKYALESYLGLTPKYSYYINAFYFKKLNSNEIVNNRVEESKKTFLWFGNNGLIHKGLDLCLDFFSQNPQFELHICGNIIDELEFCKIYKKELFQTPNIHLHGFVHIDDLKFKEILEKCCFVISPSCSEGGSPALLNVIGNGGLYPILSEESSLTIPNGIYIQNLNLASIGEAVTYSQGLDFLELKSMQLENISFVESNNSINKFKANLDYILKDFLKAETIGYK